MPSVLHSSHTGVKGVIADAKSEHDSALGRLKSNSSEDIAATESCDFVTQWRKSRVTALRNMHARSSVTSSDLEPVEKDPEKIRSYVRDVTTDEYLSTIDTAESDDIFLVFIHDQDVSRRQCISYGLNADTYESLYSRRVDTAFVRLITWRPATFVLRLTCYEAGLETIAAPGILAYRSSECIANLISLQEMHCIDHEFDAISLNKILDL